MKRAKLIMRFFAALLLVLASSLAFLVSPVADSSYHNTGPLTRLLAFQLSRHSIVTDSLIGGLETYRPAQYDIFEKLLHTATDEELTSLINHKNKTVKCYAFKGLVMKKAPLYDVVSNHIHDTSKIIYRTWGCLSAGPQVISVSEFYIYQALPHLSVEQQQKVDSLLLFQDFSKEVDFNYKLFLATSIDKDVLYKESNYNRIRELYLKKEYFFLLEILARHQRPQDIPLITNALQKNELYSTYGLSKREGTLAAVIEFPDPAFFPYLKDVHKRSLAKVETGINLKQLYTAILQYEKDKYQPLLELAITSEKSIANINDREHTTIIWSLIEESPNKDKFKSIQSLIESNLSFHEHEEVIREWI
jgi:hypothetical protein